jgi:hypothetical protein
MRHLSLSECAPSYGEERAGSDCSHWTDAAINSITSDDDIDTIIVAYRINAYLFGGHEDSYPELPMEIAETERGMVWHSYIEILRHLVESGKKVVLVLQAPELPERMEGLIYDPMSAHANLPGLSREWWSRRSAYVRQHLQEIPAGVMIVDPANSFCDEAVCYAGREEIAYYFDDDHMSVAGAGIVADEILRKLDFPVRSGRRCGAAESLASSGRAKFEAMAVGRLALAAGPISAGPPGR